MLSQPVGKAQAAQKMQKALKENLFSLKGNLGYIDLSNIKTSFKSRHKIDKTEGDKLIQELSKSKILPSLLNSIKK